MGMEAGRQAGKQASSQPASQPGMSGATTKSLINVQVTADAL